MIPWAIISAVNGDLKLAVALFVLFTIVMIVHQLLEPRIVSGHIGVHPIFTLSGVIGLFIGPIVLIILQNVFETMIDNGIVKTLLDRK